MQLAADEIAITLSGETVHLRPTLRTALRLERRHGGFDKLLRAIADGHFSIMADVIREGADRRSSIPSIIEQMGGMHFSEGFEAFAIPLAEFVFALAGIDPNSSGSQSSEGEGGPKIAFAEYHTRLYRIATGWLGWPPEQAWNSTPTEIIEAQKGRVELLHAIFGGKPEDDPSEPPPLPTREEVLSGLADLKMIAASGGNQVV